MMCSKSILFTFCRDDCYEPQELVMYSTALKSLVSSRHLKWNNATGKTLRKTFHDCEFPVSAKNHLVLSMRRYHAMYELGAVLGVELKKKLTWQGLRQAEVEFYLWADSSLYPFIQLITDMQHGGLAFYCKGGEIVNLRNFLYFRYSHITFCISMYNFLVGNLQPE